MLRSSGCFLPDKAFTSLRSNAKVLVYSANNSDPRPRESDSWALSWKGGQGPGVPSLQHAIVHVSHVFHVDWISNLEKSGALLLTGPHRAGPHPAGQANS